MLTKKAFLLFEAIRSAHNTGIFWSIFRDVLCGSSAFAGVGERADVRGENMQILLCLHGRTLTKAVPGSPIKAHWGLWSLCHAKAVFVAGLPGGALRALPQLVSQQDPILWAAAGLLQTVARDKSASLVSKPNYLYLPWEKEWGRLQ